MNQFMVEFELPTPFPPDFVAKIPYQRVAINQMLQDGKLSSYALSMDRSKLWCVVNGHDEFEVMDIISEFPLIDYMNPTITELMFNNGVVMRVPAFSLN